MFTYEKQKQSSERPAKKDGIEKPVLSQNLTGIPDYMKMRIESLSGFSFDDVRVHYNSDKPAQVQALAYTQGDRVYVAHGQERHLMHELVHVVQQKQGRVKPDSKYGGININCDDTLEKEADTLSFLYSGGYAKTYGDVVQRVWIDPSEDEAKVGVMKTSRFDYYLNKRSVSSIGVLWGMEKVESNPRYFYTITDNILFNNKKDKGYRDFRANEFLYFTKEELENLAQKFQDYASSKFLWEFSKVWSDSKKKKGGFVENKTMKSWHNPLHAYSVLRDLAPSGQLSKDKREFVVRDMLEKKHYLDLFRENDVLRSLLVNKLKRELEEETKRIEDEIRQVDESEEYDMVLELENSKGIYVKVQNKLSFHRKEEEIFDKIDKLIKEIDNYAIKRIYEDAISSILNANMETVARFHKEARGVKRQTIYSRVISPAVSDKDIADNQIKKEIYDSLMKEKWTARHYTHVNPRYKHISTNERLREAKKNKSVVTHADDILYLRNNAFTFYFLVIDRKYIYKENFGGFRFYNEYEFDNLPDVWVTPDLLYLFHDSGGYAVSFQGSGTNVKKKMIAYFTNLIYITKLHHDDEMDIAEKLNLVRKAILKNGEVKIPMKMGLVTWRQENDDDLIDLKKL